ncbi:MAG: hypothetical protein ACRD2L_22260, partial [Terriglobia bacterium]
RQRQDQPREHLQPLAHASGWPKVLIQTLTAPCGPAAPIFATQDKGASIPTRLRRFALVAHYLG